jgi:hypothetical protein
MKWYICPKHGPISVYNADMNKAMSVYSGDTSSIEGFWIWTKRELAYCQQLEKHRSIMNL